MESRYRIMVGVTILLCKTLIFASGQEKDIQLITLSFDAIERNKSICFPSSNSGSIRDSVNCPKDPVCNDKENLEIPGKVIFCNNQSLTIVVRRKTDKRWPTRRDLSIMFFFGGFLSSLAVVMVIILIKMRLCTESQQDNISETSGISPNGLAAPAANSVQDNVNASNNSQELAESGERSSRPQRPKSSRHSSIRTRTDTLTIPLDVQTVDMVENPIRVPPVTRRNKTNYVPSERLQHRGLFKEERIYENVRRPRKGVGTFSPEPNAAINA